MQTDNNNFSTSPAGLLQEVSSSHQQAVIGVPRENNEKEHRLALTPEAVALLSSSGCKILLEEGAGLGINYSDMDYSEAGAEIVDRNTVLSADIILKISPPTAQDVLQMKKRAIIFHSLQFSAMSSSTLNLMAEKSINAIAFELITPDGKDFPLRNIFSEAEGMVAVSLASELLGNERGGKGILLGSIAGVAPPEAVIIGAGAAATVATRILLAMGAFVKVFDNDISKLRRLRSETASQVFTSVFIPKSLDNAFRSADLVIGAMRYTDDDIRYMIPTETTALLKRGSVVIDLRVGLGGCFEETCMLANDDEVFERKGVTFYCRPNLSSIVARTVAMSLSNAFLQLMPTITDNSILADATGLNPLLKHGHYMYSGKMVNNLVAKHYNLPSRDIGLFLSSY